MAAGTLRCLAEKLILSALCFLSQNLKLFLTKQFHFWGLLERNVLFMFSRIQLRNATWEHFTSLKINQLFPCYALPNIQRASFPLKSGHFVGQVYAWGLFYLQKMRFFKFFLSRVSASYRRLKRFFLFLFFVWQTAFMRSKLFIRCSILPDQRRLDLHCAKGEIVSCARNFFWQRPSNKPLKFW